MPDSSGLDIYRSYIHPYRDNISVYHLEQLKPERIVLGYSENDFIFIPYCKEFWENISKLEVNSSGMLDHLNKDVL